MDAYGVQALLEKVTLARKIVEDETVQDLPLRWLESISILSNVLQVCPDLWDELQDEVVETLYRATSWGRDRVSFSVSTADNKPSEEDAAFTRQFISQCVCLHEPFIMQFQLCKPLFDSLGQCMLCLGKHMEAVGCFERACQLASAYPNGGAFLNGESNASLENVKNLIMDRWHIRMLNDQLRNDKYNDAICSLADFLRNKKDGEFAAMEKVEAKVDLKGQGPPPVDRFYILDIGSGTGILTLMALRACRTRGLDVHATGCEVNNAMSDLSQKVIHQNWGRIPSLPSHFNSSIGHTVRMLSKRSCSLCIPADIPQKVDAVVTELVDSGLLGEHILPTIMDARQRLLKV
jgi:hypothetical protein